ncbi:Ff.00g130820.m01.CDS01 [Fusarium sp. VM40]|nr:Ff.00g130820.m01.CDS01 [Fusarium sp. VM40]
MIRFSLRCLARRVAGTPPYSLPGQFPRSVFRAYSQSPNTAISTPPFRYRFIPEVETIEGYRPGGYHPIQINDSLHDDRYRIVHKLGHGSFSTAWLAHDLQTSVYVAVKIGTADADKQEAGILCRLATIPLDEPLIPRVVDQFSIDGPNGTHPCLVTTLARCSLTDAKEESDSRLFQLDVARSLAAQLVAAVARSTGVEFDLG